MTVSTVVFDWGNTLMKNFPQYTGPMAEWEQVELLPGAVEGLENLYGKVKLVVASNAADSGADQVRAALKRGGIDRYFDAVFTTRELNGFRKPQTLFFRAIEERLGVAADDLVMVGDDFQADVYGGWLAGWKTIWLNPAHAAAPGLLPIHSAEMTTLAELPTVLNALSLPSYMECLAWLGGQRASASLLAHVQGVAGAAYLMALWLQQAGVEVNPVLAHRGGLLHDLAKLSGLEQHFPGKDHGALAGILLDQWGQPTLARIADRHMLYGVFDETRVPRTWEEKLVYFADKLVEGSTLVPTHERMAALRERYYMKSDLVERVLPVLNQYQTEICSHIGIPDDELIPRLRQAVRG